ncbi:MAG: hypothetical protein ACLRRT_00040 [Ruthenibacterium lactatiformans]
MRTRADVRRRYAKILPQDRASIVERAAEGEQAARDIFVNTAVKRIFQDRRTAACLRVCRYDYISGNQRYFSDYISGQSRIHLYLGAIRLWAQENGMTLETAQNVILSHEYFHFLEWTKLGLTSREYQVPMLELGPLKLGKTGVRALSEIGAHAFARTYYELTEERERQDEATGI